MADTVTGVIEDEEDFLSTVRERYKLCVEAERDNRDRAREALAFRDLEQWDQRAKAEREGDAEGPRPCLVVDKLNQHVQQVVNDERQNRPQIKVRPVEGGDVEVAKIYDGIIRHIQDRSHADIAYDTGFECAVDGGFGYWRVLTEYCDPLSFEQDLCIRRIRNRFACYLDPARQEPDGSDAKYGFILYRVTKKEFKREFGAAAEEALGSFDHEGREFVDWYGTDWVIYAEYFWIDYKKQTIAMLPDGSVVPVESVPAGVATLKTRETQIPQVKWRKVTATKIFESGEWAGKCIPIVEVVGNELDIEGKVKRSGMIRAAMDAQRVDNYATSAFVENVALAPRSSFVAAAGQVEGYEDDWKSANRRNISTLFYKPIAQDGVLVPPPQRQAPPGIPQGWAAMMEMAEHNIQAAMGRYNASIGAPSNEKSGRAIIARQREGDVGSFHFADNLSRSLRHTGQILVDVIPKYYDTRRVARIIGEDGVPGTAIIDPGLKDEAGKPIPYAERPNEMGEIEKIYNLSTGRYDVTVITGPSYTTRRLEATEFMSQIAQAAKDPLTSQIVTYLAVKHNDLPGADEAAKMLKKILPPEIQEDDGKKDREAELQRRDMQVREAVKALGQREAELNQAVQMIEEKGAEIAASEEGLAKAKAEVEKRIALLNEAQAELTNTQQVMKLQQELAAKNAEIQRTTLQSEKDVAVAEAKVIEERLNTKLEEVNEAAANSEKRVAEQANLAEGLSNAMQAIEDVRKIALAKRRTTIEFDDTGEPVGAVSEPIIEEAA